MPKNKFFLTGWRSQESLVVALGKDARNGAPKSQILLTAQFAGAWSSG
jgi:hypothetical protein